MKPGDLVKLSAQGRTLLDEGGSIGLSNVPAPYQPDVNHIRDEEHDPKLVGQIRMQDVCLLLGTHPQWDWALVLCGGRFGWVGQHLIEEA
jgi:hypothetical protein